MDHENLNSIAKTAFWLVLIVNLLIGFHCFKYLSNTSELAGSLIELFIKIRVIALCVFFSFICWISIRLIYKYTNENITWISLIILLIGISVVNYKISMSIIRPKPPTIEEEINRIKKNAEVVKKEAQKTLQNAILFYPDKKIVLEDQNKLIHGIKSLFSSFDEGAKNDEHMSDSVRLSLINDLLSHNYREPDTVGFHSIRNSIQCEFIMYSPSCQHFIAILTHKNTTPSFDINYYNGMVLFCEKKDCGIDVYPYSHPVSQYDKYTREIYTNEVISSHFNYMGNYFLKTEEYQEHLHPMKKGFWQDKFFFDTITIENKKYLRYQTSRKYRSTKNHGYMPRPMYQIR